MGSRAHPSRRPISRDDASDAGAPEVLRKDLRDREAAALEHCGYRCGDGGYGATRRRLVEEEESSLGREVAPEDLQLPDGPLPPEQSYVDREDLVEPDITEVGLVQ